MKKEFAKKKEKGEKECIPNSDIEKILAEAKEKSQALKKLASKTSKQITHSKNT